MIALLLACSQTPWTREAALQPMLSRLDRDADGRVIEAEYTPTAWRAPDFSNADQDGDGGLSVGELDRVVFLQDPNTFDGSLERTPPDLSLGPGVSGTMDTQQRLLWELLFVLRDEALYARPDVRVPGPDVLEAAARTGDIGHSETRRALSELQRAWNISAGLTFPRALAPNGSADPAPEPAPQQGFPQGPIGPAGPGPSGPGPSGPGLKPPVGPDGRPGRPG